MRSGVNRSHEETRTQDTFEYNRYVQEHRHIHIHTLHACTYDFDYHSWPHLDHFRNRRPKKGKKRTNVV